jgi:hypothetical protein
MLVLITYKENGIYLGRLKVKGKTVLVSDSEGQYGCETSRFPHFLNNVFTDGSEVVSLYAL